MRTIEFYRLPSDACPVEEFLNSLNGKQAQKVAWVLQLVRELHRPAKQYFKKLVGTGLWEIRTVFGRNSFRLLGFFDGEDLSVLTSGFAKKSQKTSKQEIETAEGRKKEYFSRKG